jgi:hypothetical protein
MERSKFRCHFLTYRVHSIVRETKCEGVRLCDLLQNVIHPLHISYTFCASLVVANLQEMNRFGWIGFPGIRFSDRLNGALDVSLLTIPRWQLAFQTYR